MEGHMTDIKVLGPGCQRCNQLAAAAKLAADRLGIDYELEKIKDIGLYPSYGLMLTPGLVSQGKLPTVDEIEALLGGGA
jgi:hypothetical protein